MKIHEEGKKAIIIITIATLVINALSFMFLNEIAAYIILLVTLLLLLLTVNFYKKPERVYKGDLHGLVNSPTDGKIVAIEKVFEREHLNAECIKISIFMTIFNAHSNWVPVTGIVKHYSHVPGNFHAAHLPKSSNENEHSNIVIETPDHGTILTKQIAGALARRVVTYLKEGETVHIGEPLGFIKLGSRMDIYLPPSCEVMVSIGEKVWANETFIARLVKEQL